MHKVLIVEDDSVISKILRSHIETWGCCVSCIEDFTDVIGEFIRFSPDIVLLDISLPFYNGYHWCTEIRRVSKVPIIFISSASDNLNIIMAMNMGGDDFITKPFDLDVLTAKVQAVLRRTYDFSGQTNILKYKDVVLNTSDNTLTYNNTKIELTKNDYKILLILFENKEKVVSRDLMMQKLWQTDCFVDENTLTVNIARLRKKLESYGLVDFIKTKKGLGYII